MTKMYKSRLVMEVYTDTPITSPWELRSHVPQSFEGAHLDEPDTYRVEVSEMWAEQFDGRKFGLTVNTPMKTDIKRGYVMSIPAGTPGLGAVVGEMKPGVAPTIPEYYVYGKDLPFNQVDNDVS